MPRWFELNKCAQHMYFGQSCPDLKRIFASACSISPLMQCGGTSGWYLVEEGEVQRGADAREHFHVEPLVLGALAGKLHEQPHDLAGR